jgi:hypothetical protein
MRQNKDKQTSGKFVTRLVLSEILKEVLHVERT